MQYMDHRDLLQAEADAIEEVDMEDQGAELQEDGEPKITRY